MRVQTVDVVSLGSIPLRRWADELGRRRWCDISNEELMALIWRNGDAIISHVELCAMFPPAKSSDDEEPALGQPVEVPVRVTDAPALSGWRLFRAFGLDQAILTYWYAAGEPT